MANTGFICHDDYLSKTAKLTDDEVGRLFRACMTYHATGEVLELSGRESVAFDFIRTDIDKAEAAYKAKCETNKHNRLQALLGSQQNDDGQRPLTNVDERQETATNVANNKNNNNKNKNNKEEKEERLAISERFVRFWKAYPRKVGKENALKAWMSLKPDEELLSVMVQAIEKQKGTEQWQESGGQYIPHPATWLRGKRWQDEVTTTTKQKTVVAQDYEQRDYSGVQDKARKRFESMMEDDAS